MTALRRVGVLYGALIFALASLFMLYASEAPVHAQSTHEAALAAVRDCDTLVRSHGSKAKGTATAELDIRSRTAVCIGDHGFRVAAIEYLKSALHAYRTGDTSYSSPIDEQVPFEEKADARLAILEFEAGRKQEARAVVSHYYGNTAEMKLAWTLIDPIGHRRFMAAADRQEQREDQQYRAQFSSDQWKILNREGSDYRVETFDAAGYHEETWWYGGDHPRVAYTFINGVLQSVYRP